MVPSDVPQQDSPKASQAPAPARQGGALKVLTLFLLPLAVLGLLLVFNLAQGESKLKPGQPAPTFSLPDLTGQPKQLSDYKGKVLLINFWATWCGSCIQEFPAMKRMYDLHKSDQFEVLAINVDFGSSQPVERFLKKNPLEFPILLDSGNSLFSSYGISGVPESFLIDKNGAFVKKYVGPMEWDQPWFADDIKPLLN